MFFWLFIFTKWQNIWVYSKNLYVTGGRHFLNHKIYIFFYALKKVLKVNQLPVLIYKIILLKCLSIPCQTVIVKNPVRMFNICSIFVFFPFIVIWKCTLGNIYWEFFFVSSSEPRGVRYCHHHIVSVIRKLLDFNLLSWNHWGNL